MQQGKNHSSQKQKKASTLNTKLGIVLQTVQNAMRQIKKQSSQTRSISFLKRISLDLDFDLMEKALKSLQKGYIVMKHSPNTSQPHNKFIYISEDHRFLCWKSTDKQDQKIIELRKIDNVIGSSQQLHIQSLTIKSIQKVLIIKSQIRLLELQFACLQQKNKCLQELIFAVKNSKRMHLSYKF